MLKFNTFLEQISLQYHTTLNPKLFDLSSLKLHDDVRETLLTFAHAWGDYALIDPIDVKDVYMTGGNANFSYTPFSDIDVHLVFDRRSLGIPDVYLDEYLQDKKALWQLKHKVSVRGYPLEPYAQDSSESFPSGQGVYSLINNTWIIQPTQGHYDFEHDTNLQKKVQYYEKLINQTVDFKANQNNAKQLKHRLEIMRGAGLQKAGEFSTENMCYKELRNRGLIDKLRDYIIADVDSSLSLD